MCHQLVDARSHCVSFKLSGVMKKCDICNKISNTNEEDAVLYGEWKTKQNVTVHYYCLLLSTNLPQRGSDASGISGFLLRDIRKEVAAAQKRICVFCDEKGASIVCHKCGIVFHMECGFENRCVFQFCGDYYSYCEICAPRDEFQLKLLANPPEQVLCDICLVVISPFLLYNVAYGDCCRKGFAHRTCMRRYALASGYYLRCLWCREKKFHDTIRFQSVYVPDRDATWERQQNAYRELHTRLLRCEQAECLCPNGRDYNRYTWIIQACAVCAATGTHLKCLLGTKRLSHASHKETENYKCSLCIEVEQKLANRQNAPVPKTSLETPDEHIDNSLYLQKRFCELSNVTDDGSPMSTDEDTTNCASFITVVASQNLVLPTTPSQLPPSPASQIEAQPTPDNNRETTVIELMDSPPSAQQQLACAFKTPLLLHESFTIGDHFYLVIYEYNEQLSDPCTGTCTLRFALDEERLKDKSEEALQQLQLTEADVWFRDTNRGIYDTIDKYNLI